MTTPPAKPTLLQRLHLQRKTPPALAAATPPTGRMGTSSIPTGTIIGDKKTGIFHLPGDKNLPNINNRVYFNSPAQAKAAGFRQAGMTGRSKAGTMKRPKTK